MGMQDMPLGTVIARARQRKRWTQEELAKRLGVTRSAVTAWETRNIYPSKTAGAIEDVLGIDLSGYEHRKAS